MRKFFIYLKEIHQLTDAMRTSAVIVAFIFAISSPQWTIGATCSRQNLIDCEMEAAKFLHTINETENGANEFCDNLGKNSECPLDLDEDCKTQYPTASKTYLKFFGDMVAWCNRSSAERKLWFKVAFCARMHKKGFHKCHKLKYDWFNNGTFDCRYWDFISCWGQAVSNYCGEEAETLAKYINDQIPEKYDEYCNTIKTSLKGGEPVIPTKRLATQWANGVPCSEQNMNDCQKKAVYIFQSENGYDDFCDNIRNNRECPMDLDEDCEEQYPTASATYISFFREMVRWCKRSSSDRKAWFKIASCARKQPIEFNKCLKTNYKWFKNGIFDSKYFDFVSCWSQKASKYCDKEAEALSKYIMTAFPRFMMSAAKFSLVSPATTGY